MPNFGYTIVPDSIPRDGKTDVTESLQKFIDENANKTLFFPDGTYLISDGLKTSSSPERTVSFAMSKYAVIKADGSKWKTGEAMLRLGAVGEHANGEAPTSHTSVTGGVLDGDGVADGISIDSGIQNAVSEMLLTNVRLGIHIQNGANNGSADADITGVNIYGNGKADSVGILIDAHDNTLTNIRIGKMHTGVILNRGANSLRNVHPLLYGTDGIADSAGFEDNYGTNWYDFCYSDQFVTAFRLGGGVRSFFKNCYVFWYDDFGDGHTVFDTDGTFDSVADTLKVCFRNKTDNVLLREGISGGTGTLSGLYIDNSDRLSPLDAYKKYLK